MNQLLLGIGLRDSESFANFYPAQNEQVLQGLQQTDEAFIYLWGSRGCGKTHLLQAMCRQLAERGQTVAYLPLKEEGMMPQMLEGMEMMSLLAIDDLDRIAGNAEWEAALFHLYNRIRDAGGRLLVAARVGPAALPVQLRDLASRLSYGLTLQMHEPGDEEKLKLLQLRAANRGFDLPQEVANYLLKRCERDMTSLIGLLERLDSATLQAQRKLTIPFVKSLLS